MKAQKLNWLFPLIVGILLVTIVDVCATNSDPVTDIDGNDYKTVIIGDQEWFAENLKTTMYNDGSAIPNITANRKWRNLSSGAYCWYDNDTANAETYGALYNWYAVNTGKLCPEGWRVPTVEDWTKLTNYLGGKDIAGIKLKARGNLESGNGLWYDKNRETTNVTGFSALPGGYRGIDGKYYVIGTNGIWWVSCEQSSKSAWGQRMGGYFGSVIKTSCSKKDGFSLRCCREVARAEDN